MENPIICARAGCSRAGWITTITFTTYSLPRDHWRRVEPRDRVAIVEFEPFARTLEHAPNLHEAIDELLRYDWLPVGGISGFRTTERRQTV